MVFGADVLPSSTSQSSNRPIRLLRHDKMQANKIRINMMRTAEGKWAKKHLG